MIRLSLCLCCFFAAAINAQPLQVFSEFARIGPTGEPTTPRSPREILSPALARNDFATFQILVKAEKGVNSSLWVGQNPENSFQVTLYREEGGELKAVKEPVEIQGTAIIWMDVWVRRETPVSRLKLEPELYIDKDWVIYPMEVRVVEATVRDVPQTYGSTSAFEVMRAFVCGTKAEISHTSGEPVTRASFSHRNALADVALAEQAPLNEVRKVFGACDQPPPENPEDYLRIRDYLLRLR